MEVYVIVLWSVLVAVKAEYCGKFGDKEFYCDEGRCCGDLKCCTYYQYYEMWWFWLIWVVILILGCTCAYYRKYYIGPYSRLSNYWYAMLQPQQQRTGRQRGSPGSFKLPSYEEAIQMPQLGPPEDNEGAPPPYGDFVEQDNNNHEDNFATSLQTMQEGNIPEGSPPEYTPLVITESNA